jgi:sigma-B regulation protein RsbU (phosphoserine phosphatase)
MYITMFLGWYEIATGSLRYVNAAHPLPWRIDSRGEVTSFGEVSGSMVGILPGQTYTEGRETLRPGDRLVLYTDGVPEAEGPDEEFLGDERFRSLLRETAGESVQKLTEHVAAEVDAYQEGRRSDDVTLLTILRKR